MFARNLVEPVKGHSAVGEISSTHNDVSHKSSKCIDDKIDLSEGEGESGKHMKSSKQPLPFSMGIVHYMNHIRYHGLNISTTSSSLLVGAIIFTLFPTAFSILVPPPYIPRLQLHRPLHYYSNQKHGWNRIGDDSIPFGYRLYPYPQYADFRVQNGAERNNDESQNVPQHESKLRMRHPQETNPDEETNEKVFQATHKSPSRGLEKKGTIEQERVSDGYGSEDKDPSFDKTSSSISTRQESNIYNSYQKFNPGQFEENSPEWQMAMLQYLLDMKDNGHNVQEVSYDKPLKELHQEFKQNKETKNDLNFEDDQSNVFPTGFDNVENLKMISAGRGDPIVCRLEPFNLCYRFDKSGTMHPLGNRRPVRLIRVYK